jgi:hypothetical protein
MRAVALDLLLSALGFSCLFQLHQPADSRAQCETMAAPVPALVVHSLAAGGVLSAGVVHCAGGWGPVIQLGRR